jgi:hypothetical protein
VERWGNEAESGALVSGNSDIGYWIPVQEPAQNQNTSHIIDQGFPSNGAGSEWNLPPPPPPPPPPQSPICVKVENEDVSHDQDQEAEDGWQMPEWVATATLETSPPLPPNPPPDEHHQPPPPPPSPPP